jgi:hypothetical protein
MSTTSVDGEAPLASEALLSRLTLRPLKALCTAYGVDHALSGKKKEAVVARLLTLRKVTSAEAEAHLSGNGSTAPSRSRGGQGAAKAAATRRAKLEAYFASGGAGLPCTGCGQPLREVREMQARHASHTFTSVSCGGYPRCKRTHKLSDVYVSYCRLQCPRVLFEAHCLRGLLGATVDAFSVSVDASSGGGRAVLRELLADGTHGLARLTLAPASEDDRRLVDGTGGRLGVLFHFRHYRRVEGAAQQLLEAKWRQAGGSGASSSRASGSGANGSGASGDVPPPLKLTGLPECPAQLRLFLHAAGVADAASGGGEGEEGWEGLNESLACEGEARLRACGLWPRLRSYQQEGVVRALQLGGVAMVADEMGLGKTLTALATVAAMDAWPCLAIVPAVTRRGWADEAEAWLGGLLSPSDIHVVYDQ